MVLNNVGYTVNSYDFIRRIVFRKSIWRLFLRDWFKTTLNPCHFGNPKKSVLGIQFLSSYIKLYLTPFFCFAALVAVNLLSSFWLSNNL